MASILFWLIRKKVSISCSLVNSPDDPVVIDVNHLEPEVNGVTTALVLLEHHESDELLEADGLLEDSEIGVVLEDHEDPSKDKGGDVVFEEVLVLVESYQTVLVSVHVVEQTADDVEVVVAEEVERLGVLVELLELLQIFQKVTFVELSQSHSVLVTRRGLQEEDLDHRCDFSPY